MFPKEQTMTRHRIRMAATLVLVLAAVTWGSGPVTRAAGMAGDAVAMAMTGTETTAASDAAAAPQSARARDRAAANAQGQQTVVSDATGRPRARMQKVTPIQRRAAAARLKAKMARASGRVGRQTLSVEGAAPQAPADLAPMALIDPGGGQALPVPSYYKIDNNGQLFPDYSGAVANWANSPRPVVTTTDPVVTPIQASRLAARQYATGTVNLLAVFSEPLPAGTLTAFQSFNQYGGINTQSAGRTFHAYVLRPTGANTYTVLYSSGLLTVPPLSTPQVSEVASYPANVAVEEGDVLAFWGQGIPMDVSNGGPYLDAYYYQASPAVPAPAQGASITVGTSPFSNPNALRTFAFGAIVEAGGTQAIVGGMRKFVDGLPGLGAGAANNLGQYLPVAVPDTTTYEGSDYYEIELGQYTEQMHSDLPPTTLRGYRQTNMGGTPFHYLGPAIVAHKGRPVRVKFTNNLPAGAGGKLFIPVDKTIMGAGIGPAYPGWDGKLDAATICETPATMPTPAACYTENRATIHLHGGVTPWISDGTTHQWITPAAENTQYPKGVSVYNVPDMPNPGKPPLNDSGIGSNQNDPSRGVQTFYYTNDQSARLMFYHDHAHGITRLNVYVGEAAAYILRDQVELDLVGRGLIPGDEIPLVIQDKTFVDAATIRNPDQDPTWNWGTSINFTQLTDDNGTPDDPNDDRTMMLREPKTGDLWWPHVYQPAQNPDDLSGYNAMGRWNYGPWFWPPTNDITYLPLANPYYDCNALGLPDATHPCTMPWQPKEIPNVPNPSWGAEAFLDTPVINGTAYPTLTVQPKAYRFRLLNAAHDRFWNLQWYVAADKNADTTFTATTPAPICDGAATIPAADCTEVRMVRSPDGREGGIPDRSAAVRGPDWIAIGTEGGFLPMPVVVPSNQYVVWNGDPLTFNFGNVTDFSLLMGPAERHDVIVDFSQYAGKTLILYNDAPAAFPALDPRNDYYTGMPDLREQGGIEGVLPGYGPNIRTIMQVRVEGPAAPPFDLAALEAAWRPVTDASGNVVSPGVFQQSQDPIIAGQSNGSGTPPSNYEIAYGMQFPDARPYWGYSNIYSTSLSFMPPQPCNEADPLACIVTIPMKTKAIQDEMGETFDEYGRMRSSLGITFGTPQGFPGNTFVLEGFSDPPTELIQLSRLEGVIPPVGSAYDGTQVWKITHNGVDTHPVHFHLFHVQLINRVGWDGAIRIPHPTELGWKDTVRLSPLEDTIVALRPITPGPESVPFDIPNSLRAMEPALPLGLSWPGMDPNGDPVTITNGIVNYGWEYIWHCHILSHEENDMMRAVGFNVPPATPTGLTAVARSGAVDLSWTDNSLRTTSFLVQKTEGSTVTDIQVEKTGNCSGTPATCTYTDTVGANPGPLTYVVKALNTIGSSVPGFPTLTTESLPSDPASPTFAAEAAVAPTSLAFGEQALSTTSPPQPVTLSNTGSAALTFTLSITGANAADFAQANSCNGTVAAGGSCTIDVTFQPTAIGVRSAALEIGGTAFSVALSGTGTQVAGPPAAPTSATGSAARLPAGTPARGQNDTVTLNWTHSGDNVTGFEVQRSRFANYASALPIVTVPGGGTARTFTELADRSFDWYYRIRAVNAQGTSAWVNVLPQPIITP